MQPAVPVSHDLVLIGGGHAHVAVLKRFGMRPQPGVRLTLIARDVETPYSGMLPGLIAGHYDHAEAHIDLRRLARFAQARLYHAAAEKLDLDQGLVRLAGRPPVPFDLLSIDVGSTPTMNGIPGAREHAIAVKPVDRFLQRWRALQAELPERSGPVRLVVIGAGAGGVELALSLQHRLCALDGLPTARLELTVLTDRAEPLPGHAPAVRRRLSDALAARGIRLRTHSPVTAVAADHVLVGDGERIACDAAILVTHAAAPAWLADSALALDERGFIRIDDRLRSTSHGHVFAAGDVAAFSGRALPKSGVYAVRQGPFLADNLQRAATARPLRRYRPQARTLALISTGDRNAIASYGALALQGQRLWRAKDWIDRRWMAKYQVLPEMAADDGPLDEAGHPVDMRCGGCGAKVASAVLRRVLTRLAPQFGDDVVLGLEAGDDAAVLDVPAGRSLVQSVDQFRAFIDDPYLFARIAANHALGDLYAMGAEPRTAQALVTLPYASEAKLETDLEAVMTGALETFAAAGVALVGGHTGEGAELTLGFTVNGSADPEAVLRKAGLRPGDALVLTKPLGTGAVFAADMQGKAPAAVVGAALDSMLRSNAAALAVLRAHDVTACTDVTGFGLAGHLIEMLRGGGLAADLALDRVPVIPGAAALVDQGFTSSLQDANEAFAAAVDGGDGQAARYRLLFDPQTAGGLLAGIPAERADACVAALHVAGDPSAARIGHVGDGPGGRIHLISR